jgi:CheY-like chemotaxis protein
MIVDDDANQIELVSYNLENADQVIETCNALRPQDALKILREKRIDCVVSDFILPGMTGIQLCKMIKDFLSVPFILYTGRESDEVPDISYVDDYIHKEPNLIHYTILAKKIRDAVEKYRKT